jgi:hypothetical protein
MAAGRVSSPSEQTPLIPSSHPDDESIPSPLSIPRGVAIAFFMELLILIQSALEDLGNSKNSANG